MLRLKIYLFILPTLLLISQIKSHRFTKEKIREVGEKCGANQADLEIAMKYGVPETESGKCLMLCMLKHAKTLKDDGEYDEDYVLESLKVNWSEIPEKDLKTVANECKSHLNAFADKVNTCEHGYQTIKCINAAFLRNKLFPSTIQSE